MKRFHFFVLAMSLVSPLLAGTFYLQAGNPNANAEARALDAVLVVRVGSCQSPEKTIIAATAEGIVEGKQRSIPLKTVSLSEPGTLAVTHQWPRTGIWAIRVIATNPDYKGAVRGLIVPIADDKFAWDGVKTLFRDIQAEDIRQVLESNPSR